jgi:hypothetical protein
MNKRLEEIFKTRKIIFEDLKVNLNSNVDIEEGEFISKIIKSIDLGTL